MPNSSTERTPTAASDAASSSARSGDSRAWPGIDAIGSRRPQSFADEQRRDELIGDDSRVSATSRAHARACGAAGVRGGLGNSCRTSLHDGRFDARRLVERREDVGGAARQQIASGCFAERDRIGIRVIARGWRAPVQGRRRPRAAPGRRRRPAATAPTGTEQPPPSAWSSVRSALTARRAAASSRRARHCARSTCRPRGTESPARLAPEPAALARREDFGDAPIEPEAHQTRTREHDRIEVAV